MPFSELLLPTSILLGEIGFLVLATHLTLPIEILAKLFENMNLSDRAEASTCSDNSLAWGREET